MLNEALVAGVVKVMEKRLGRPVRSREVLKQLAPDLRLVERALQRALKLGLLTRVGGGWSTTKQEQRGAR